MPRSVGLLVVAGLMLGLAACQSAATSDPSGALPHLDPGLEAVLPASANGIAFQAVGSTDGEDGIGNEGLYGGIFPAIIDTIGIDHAADLLLADATQPANGGWLVVRVFRLRSVSPAATWAEVLDAAQAGPSQPGLTTWSSRTLGDRDVLVSAQTEPAIGIVEVVQRGELLWEVSGPDASLVDRIVAALP